MQSPSLFHIYIYIVFPSTIKKDRYPNVFRSMAAAEPRRHDSFIRHLCQGEIPTIASLALIPSFPASFVIFHPYPATFSLPFPLRFEGLRVAVKKEKGKRKERHGKIKWPSLPSSWRPIRRSTVGGFLLLPFHRRFGRQEIDRD